MCCAGEDKSPEIACGIESGFSRTTMHSPETRVRPAAAFLFGAECSFVKCIYCVFLSAVWQHYTVEGTHSWIVFVARRMLNAPRPRNGCFFWVNTAQSVPNQNHQLHRPCNIATCVLGRVCSVVFRANTETFLTIQSNIKHARVCVCVRVHFLGLEHAHRPRDARQMHARSYVISTPQ